jgi:hypothetical protein
MVRKLSMWLCGIAFAGAAFGDSAYDRVLAQIAEKTGLQAVTIPETGGSYLGKTHRGYRVVYMAKAGDVWGRFAARLTMAELGRETGGLLAYATGQDRASPDVVGSPLDKLLSEQIGQPLSVTVVLRHGKAHAPRLDVLAEGAHVHPGKALARHAQVGARAGFIYSDDDAFADRLAANEALMKRLKNLRGEYIRVDRDAVTLFWSGTESDFSGMLRDHGDYYAMLNAFLDDLADIADAIPPAR